MNGFATPAAIGVLGLEYQTANLGDLALIELLGERLMNKPVVPLLAALHGPDLDPVLGGSLGVDFRGYWGSRPSGYVVRPALRYKASDSFSVLVGVLLVGGSPYSFGWYYGDNDSAFVQLRQAF